MNPTVRRLAPVLALLCVVLGAPVPARADAPERLASPVTDRVGALPDRRPIDEALTRLSDDTGLQLFVVFVDSFDGTPAQTWTDRTAQLSDLGDRDALLAVATTDRAYAYSLPPDSAVSDAEADRVARDGIEPALARADWPAAVIAAADGYRAAGSGGGSTGGAGSLIGVLVVLAAVIIGALLWVRARRRTAGRPTGRPDAAPAGPFPTGPSPTGPPPVSTEDLGIRANALLIELDDDLRASERELSLATAQYGADATARFRSAYTAARDDVAEAFRLRMTLDEPTSDATTPDEPTRRRTYDEIIRRCEAADARLDAESEEFDRLRDIEGRLDEVTDDIEARRTKLDADLPAADTALHELTSRYAGATVTAVAGNVQAARERLAFAADAVRRARTVDSPAGSAPPAGPTPPAGSVPPGGVGGGGADRAEAALAVRAAEQAVDQAEQLIAAVRQAGLELASARTSVDGLIAEIQAEIAAGRATLDTGRADASPGLAAAVAGAQQTLTTVRASLTGPVIDPAAAVARLEEADAALDRALAEVRDVADRTARARGLLAQVLPVARAEVAAAGDFVTTRRGAVGGTARAWLSEAQRHLGVAEGVAGTDPLTAVAEAQEAHRLATAASRQAHDDVRTWSGPGGGSGGFDTGSFAGAVLGGILAGGGGLGRGGGHGGGWSDGGSGWSGGGFGGSATRTRRTGGGRF